MIYKIEYINKIKRTYSRLKQITKESNKSYLGILWNYLILRKKTGITFYEYYAFEFEKQTEFFINTFLSGSLKEKLLSVLNPRERRITSKNKYLTHLLLKDMGVPKSELYLYYNPQISVSRRDIAHNYSDVYNILIKKQVKKFVVKTTESTHGEGVVLYNKVTLKKDLCYLERFDSKIVELSDILKNEPLIFEEYIEQTDQFKKFNKNSVNTVRFMTILLPTGEAKIIATFLKIGKSNSCVDNAGSGGNIDAAIDIETGKIHSAIIFKDWRKVTPINNHPDTGVLIDGVTIENWDKIKQKVIQFQKSHPFLKAIGWDIAITKNGPVVIETNSFWDQTGQLFIKKGWKKEIFSCYEAWVKHIKN